MLRRTLAKLRSLPQRFARGEEGVAAVEFALILPLLLLLYFGSMEAAVLFTADKRVNSVSATVGDLVSQWDARDGKIPTATMNDYFSAAAGILAPYSTPTLKQVITVVQVKANGTTKILWSQGYNGGLARTVGQPFAGLPTTSAMNMMAVGGCVIAAETTYLYKPLLGLVFNPALTLAHTNYFMPRLGSDHAIVLDTKAVADTACTT
jgi:Flp pilus assembly protein TadG